jgi:hypothetical protein
VQQQPTRLFHKLLPVGRLGLTHACLRLPLDSFRSIRIQVPTFSANLFSGDHFRGPGGRRGRRRSGAADAEDEVPAVQAAHVHDQERHQEPLHQGQGRLQGVRAEVSGGADECRMCVSCKDLAIEIVAGCSGSASETRSRAAMPVHFFALLVSSADSHVVLVALPDSCLIIADLHGCSRDPHS